MIAKQFCTLKPLEILLDDLVITQTTRLAIYYLL